MVSLDDARRATQEAIKHADDLLKNNPEEAQRIQGQPFLPGLKRSPSANAES